MGYNMTVQGATKPWIMLFAWQSTTPVEPPGPSPSPSEKREAVMWPVSANWVVRFTQPAEPFVVDVEARVQYSDEPPKASHASDTERLVGSDGSVRYRTVYATAIAVRSGAPLTTKRSWPEGESFAPVIARDAQRLPLGALVRSALATIRDPLSAEGRGRAERAGRSLEHGSQHYDEVLDRLTELEEDPNIESPAAVLAADYGVTKDLIYVWKSRALKKRVEGKEV